MLSDDGRKQQYIRTIHEKGFTFTSEVELHEKVKVDNSPDNDFIPVNQPSGSISTDRKPSIAVIGFSNLDSDPDKQFISDGITEGITTALLKVSILVVMVYPSSSSAEESITNKLSVARNLGIDYLLESSVRSEGDNLRISSRLIVALCPASLGATLRS